MSIERKNTLVVDFGVLPVRPDVPKIHEFLEKKVQLQLSEVENIQLNSIRNCVFIEVKDSEIAARYRSITTIDLSFTTGTKALKSRCM